MSQYDGRKPLNDSSLMAKKLYVGNFPYSTTDADLQQMFQEAGSVESAAIIMDKMSGRSKGFGFVEMADDAGAAKAIEMFNGKDLGGRALVVNEARPKEEGGSRDRGGFRGGNRDGGYGGGNDRQSRW